MKYLSVCSGIEAATVAWHGLGWEPVAFSEIEAFPAAVLEHHYPKVRNLGDLTKYREWPEELLVQVDLLVGGTPCQAFSVAGLRKSLNDERGNLSLIYVHLFHHINEVRKRHGRSPAVAVWENVPGVLSTKDNAFGCFLGGLMGCDEAPETESGKWDKAGFLSSEAVRVGYRVLDAQFFGVAQRRRRVFLVAVPCELVAGFGERACPSEILSLRESVLGNPPARGAAWERVTGTIAGCANGGVFGSGRDSQDTFIVSNDPAHAICANEQRTYTNEGSVFQLRNVVGCVNAAAVSVDTYNQTISDVSIPVRVGNAKDSLPAALVRSDLPRDAVIAAQGQTVAFRPTGGTHSVEATYECSPTIKVGSGVGIPSPPAVFIEANRALSNTDDGTWVQGEVAPTQGHFDVGDTRATTVVAVDLQNVRYGGDISGTLDTTRPSRGGGQAVAFNQNCRDEVRPTGGDGQSTGALSADTGMHQTNYIAFANRTRDGVKVPEVMKDGVSPALTNPGDGGRSDSVNVVAFNGYQRTEQEATWPIGASDGKKVEVGVRSGMQIRRLTPTECEYLQGFPEGYTAVAYRGKPAADGPRYRALGNSMAVPCMWWIGKRIHEATQPDS